jgi:hypothetical protein
MKPENGAGTIRLRFRTLLRFAVLGGGVLSVVPSGSLKTE